MPQVIDLEGLPDFVAKEIAETVLNLKSRYNAMNGKSAKPLQDLPSHPGKVTDRCAALTSMPSGSDAFFVDANVLVYAAVEDDPRNKASKALLQDSSGGALHISPQIVTEFYSTITSPSA